MIPSFDSNKILNTTRYKYPKEIYEKLFECEDKLSDKFTISTSISKLSSQKLSLPEYYFDEKNSRIVINNENFNENYKPGKLPQLKLQKDHCSNLEEENSIDKIKPIKDDKLELEDWLDQVL